jgi:putative salt-induced outer membrane protein YdiY
MRVSNLAAAAALLLPLFAFSQAHADWSGKGEAGLVIATGNTETKTANAKLLFANEVDKWKHQFGGAALYASSDPEGTTAQRWEAFEQSDYNFSPRTFWFGAVRYEDDEFSGFEYQAVLSTGIGRKFIDSDITKFVGTAGVGYKRFETRDAFDDTGVLIEPGASDSEVVFRGTLDYDHKLTRRLLRAPQHRSAGRLRENRHADDDQSGLRDQIDHFRPLTIASSNAPRESWLSSQNITPPRRCLRTYSALIAIDCGSS